MSLHSTFLAVLVIAAAMGFGPARAAPGTESGTNGPVVVLSVVVESDGTVSNATVARSSGNAALDWLALDHARQMKLAPSTRQGVPVRSQKIIAIAVKPRDDGAAPAARPPISRTRELLV